MFELSLFPSNVPLPEPETLAWLAGGSMHATQMALKVMQYRSVDYDEPWRDEPWFSWVCTIMLDIYAEE